MSDRVRAEPSSPKALQEAYEVNFDGLVGPTHHYAGLSFGNVASLKNRANASNPREAALQGLQKMKFLSDLGLKQAILPPQQRPDLRLLRRLGFGGSAGCSDAQVLSSLEKAMKASARSQAAALEELLSAASSASAMWTANAGTVAPSADTADGRVHLTPASLATKLHRSIEAETTKAVFDSIFADTKHFAVHDPLPVTDYFGDEGAANHTRFCGTYGGPGVHLFVFGRWAGREALRMPQHTGRNVPVKFPARQTFEASQAIARLHQLQDEQIVYAQQNPRAIDAGAFHNDVVSVGNENVLFFHEDAFADTNAVLTELRKKVRRVTGRPLVELCVLRKAVPLKTAVSTYLFNSQLISTPGGGMALVAPTESEENRAVSRAVEELVARPRCPVNQVYYLNLRQSMKNGGGPACLRLRVALTRPELKALNQGVVLTDALYLKLVGWVTKYYRDRLSAKDLLDPALAAEGQKALDELTQLLRIGSVYPFQR